MKYDLIIIGAGASGLMAANIAVENGLRPLIIEKNEKAGKKLYITGKGRCNFTNASDFDTIIENITTNSRFMYSSLNAFSNNDVIDHFRKLGLEAKIERGNRVFPASDKSSDVIKALLKAVEGKSDILYNTSVIELITKDGRVSGVKCTDKSYYCDNVVVACGGLSYPSTGSTGDGYKFASKAGLKVNKCSPSIVPFNVEGETCRMLQGLTLKNIRINIESGGKVIYDRFGELLFTHFGVSGPVILSASSEVDKAVFEKHPLLHIDLKPALDKKSLDMRILRDFKENINKDFGNSLSGLLPSKLIPVIIKQSGIPADKKTNSVTKEERAKLVDSLKDMTLRILSLRGFEEAVITKGGVDVKELKPKSFESKKIKGLYFIGEVVDVDALTGGYNLQIAWSSAFACAKDIADCKSKGG